MLDEDFRKILIKIIALDGSRGRVIETYAEKICVNTASLFSPATKKLEFYNGETDTNLKSIIGIISNMKNVSDREKEIANNFMLELCDYSNLDIPRFLQVDILIFIHFILLKCQRLEDVIPEKSVSIVICSIEKILNL